MTDPEQSEVESGAEAGESADEGPPSTPFDHPLFLPVILIGLALWFGWDGFITQDPKMQEHRTFNRGGFALLATAAVWYSYQAYREIRATGSSDAPDQG